MGIKPSVKRRDRRKAKQSGYRRGALHGNKVGHGAVQSGQQFFYIKRKKKKKKKKMKTKIYGFFNGVDPWKDNVALAITEHGQIVAQHMCSNESFAAHDLGMDGKCTRKHDTYDELLGKDNWEVEYVDSSKRDDHEGLQKAFKLNRGERV